MAVFTTHSLDVALTKLTQGESVRYCGPHQYEFLVQAEKAALSGPFKLVMRTDRDVTVWVAQGVSARSGPAQGMD